MVLPSFAFAHDDLDPTVYFAGAMSEKNAFTTVTCEPNDAEKVEPFYLSLRELPNEVFLRDVDRYL